MEQMKPGRELDALVAEKVMGWRRHDSNRLGTYGEDPIGLWIKNTEPSLVRLPQFSEDIAAAWEVVEKFHRFVVTRMEMPVCYDARVVYYFGMGNFEEFAFTADTAPHAICLAALKAVTQESKKT